MGKARSEIEVKDRTYPYEQTDCGQFYLPFYKECFILQKSLKYTCCRIKRSSLLETKKGRRFQFSA